MNRAVAVARAVAGKIAKEFPASPEGRQMFALVRRSIRDLFSESQHRDARRYLSGEIPAAESCGVNSVWIREQLVKAGIDLTQPSAGANNVLVSHR